MTIHISHASNFDFKNELYLPIQSSQLVNGHTFIFPHENSNIPFETKPLLENKKCELVIAEVSRPSTGQGIELGWADIYKIPILCIHKTGAEISGSLKVVTDNFLEYSDGEDMVKKIGEYLKNV